MMKNVKINVVAIACIVITGIVLVNVTITQNEKNTINNSTESLSNTIIETKNVVPLNSDNVTITNEGTTPETTQIYPENTTIKPETTIGETPNSTVIPETTSIVPTETTITSQMFNNESELVSYIQEVPNDVQTYINKENATKAKDYAVDKFIQIVDFICYDEEIGGIKFSDLTDSAKKDVIKTYETLDQLVENKFPGYKETIKDKTGKAYDYVKNIIVTKKQELENYIESTVGSDNYQLFQDELDEVNQDTKDTIDDIKEEGSKAWQKVKEKYEEFRENNK